MKKLFALALLAACVLTAAGCAETRPVSSDIENTKALAIQTAGIVSSTQDNYASTISVSSDTESASAHAQSAEIDETSAKAIALEHAALSADDVTYTFVQLEFEGGRYVYDLEFHTDDCKEFEYEIDAASGEIISYDWESDASDAAPSSAGGTVASQENDSLISLEDAKTAALRQAEVSETDVSFTETSFEEDDGRSVYQIDFICGTKEYEFEIDAKTGAVLEYEIESIHG